MIDLDLSKYDKIAQRFEQEARDDVSFLKSGIATRNHAFNKLIQRMERVAQGLFREDLLARIHLWTFELPGLADRREDIEPNLVYELDQYRARHGTRVTFNREAIAGEEIERLTRGWSTRKPNADSKLVEDLLGLDQVMAES